MTLADARALVPELKVKKAAPAADLRALKGLARWAVRYTPWVNIEGVNVDGSDGLILDISGCGHLFGGEDALSADISARLRGFGLAHRLAVAPTRGAAWALARYGADSDAVTSMDGNSVDSILENLGSYPVEALRINPDVALTLRRLGLKTIAQVADIPRIALKRRFPSRSSAEAVLLRLDQTLGEAGEPVSPLTPAPAFRTRATFPEPVTNPAVIAQALDGLLHDLMAVLEADNMGARRLGLMAWCVDGSVSHIGLGTSRPSRDAGHLSFLFREKLEQLEIKDGIDLLLLSAEGVEVLPRQQISLVSARISARASAEASGVPVSQLVDRLSNRLGGQAVHRSILCESHIPERAENRQIILDMKPPTRARNQHLQRPMRPMRPVRPVRLFENPEPMDVIAEVPDGPPLRFRWRRMSVRVALAEGPERISPEWWRHVSREAGGAMAKDITKNMARDIAGDIARDTRDYYRLEDDLGRRFWVYRAGLYQNLPHEMPVAAPVPPETDLPRWFMHGLFA